MAGDDVNADLGSCFTATTVAVLFVTLVWTSRFQVLAALPTLIPASWPAFLELSPAHFPSEYHGL